MSQVMHAIAGLARRHGRARGLVGWLYTSNPFYILSADLVFIGLRMSFDTSGRSFETGALADGRAPRLHAVARHDRVPLGRPRAGRHRPPTRPHLPRVPGPVHGEAWRF